MAFQMEFFLNGILIFGALKPNETALLVWIILTSIGIVGVIFLILALIFISLWDGMTVEDISSDAF